LPAGWSAHEVTVTDDARRHHYVPACYLKHFAVPTDRYAGKLHVYDRISGKSWTSSPDNSAHERDFYRVDVEGEVPNLAENTYEALETLFAPTLGTVSDRGTLPQDSDGMADLFTFIASQAVRTVRVREMQSRFYNDTAMLFMRTLAEDKDAFMARFRAKSPGASERDAEEMFATHLEFVNAKGARVDMDQSTLVRDSLALTNAILDELTWRWWILGVAPDDTDFVTTDDPVHLQPSGPEYPKHPLWSPAFGDRHTNVLVSLTPRLILVGRPYEYTARARVRFSRREVAGINMDLALSAHRFVYSTRSTFAHIGIDGSVVDGPNEALRCDADRAPARGGFFSSSR
jgi:hypothetical protein